jgi:hypothetical protein
MVAHTDRPAMLNCRDEARQDGNRIMHPAFCAHRCPTPPIPVALLRQWKPDAKTTA